MDKIDDPQVFLPELWSTHAKFSPDKEAVVCGEVRRTWGAFDANMNRIANLLLDGEIGRGDKVAVLMGNSVETLEVIYGVVRAGACVVPLSGLLTEEQLQVLITDSGAVAVVASEMYSEKVSAIRRNLAAIADQRFFAADFAGEGWTHLPTLMGTVSDAFPKVRYRMDDAFNVIYSSGTTGLPKGIVQTHRARQHWSFSNALEMGFASTSKALTTTPLYSNGTWLMVLPLLFAGGTLVVMPEFNARAFLETVAGENITHTFMVPTQIILTLAEPDFDRFDLGSLQAVLSAGSPLRPDTKSDLLQRMTPNLYELYGYSEGFATMNRPHTHALKPLSVGTPVLGFDVKIFDDDGRECEVDEAGEIAGYGAGLMKEYHNRPDLTAEIIVRDSRGRSFVRSGDIGKLDEDGFLYILDRKKDMIISGGFNIFPADLEAVIGEHEDVLDVTVIGIPHEKWGETPLALVIPQDGSKPDIEEITAWANQRLGKHQRISGVELRQEFPRNALGKVIKRHLREPYWA